MSWFKDRMVGAGIISSNKLKVAPVIPDFTEAVESGNAISVLIQMKDSDGTTVARAVDLLCELHDGSGLIADVSAWELAEIGTGDEVSRTGKPTLIITTSSSGAASVGITDISGSYTGDMFLVVTPLNTLGTPGLVTVTFA